MPSSSAIVQILWRHKKREELTKEELDELRLWLMESPLHEELFDELSNTAKWDREIKRWQSKDPNATWMKIQKRIAEMSPESLNEKRKTNWIRYVAAAAACILIATGIYWWINRKQTLGPAAISHLSQPHEILPAVNTATLTLGDGSIIQLNKIHAGAVARQGNTNIIKTDSAELSYQVPINSHGSLDYNTLSTPRGSQYMISLPDGSKVWLNALSTLRFPAAFGGGVRKVELSGEAYFEVVYNKLKPFIVQTGHSITLRVLGTHFNVEAYPNEPLTNATLLEGSISVSNGKDSAVIKPGQEVRLNEQGQFGIIAANPEQATAWRNKLFWFQKARFDEIMRQLSRWYDIDVVYEGKINQSYSGILPTNLPLSNLLHIIESGGNVHFTIGEGNKVTVRP